MRHPDARLLSALLSTGILLPAKYTYAEPFSYYAPGDLAPDSGMGTSEHKLYAPGILFPIEAGGFANSQVYRPGGSAYNGMATSQCDSSNYDFPWRDNFCETRTWSTPLCPGGTGHQGQDIRPPSCANAIHPALAVVDGSVAEVGASWFSLRSGRCACTTADVTCVAPSTYVYRHVRWSSEVPKPKLGQCVKRGDRLALVSNIQDAGPPGTYTTIHLHLEIEQSVLGRGTTVVPPFLSLIDAFRSPCASSMNCSDGPDARDVRHHCVGMCGEDARTCAPEAAKALWKRYSAGSDAIGYPIDLGHGSAAHTHGGVVLQEFAASLACPIDPAKTSALVVANGGAAAYHVNGPIWSAYRCLKADGGPRLLGPPLEEAKPISIGGTSGLRQLFLGGYVWWGHGVTCPSPFRRCTHVHFEGLSVEKPIELDPSCKSQEIVINNPGPGGCTDSCKIGDQVCTGTHTRSFCGSGFGGSACLSMSPDQACDDRTACVLGECVSTSDVGAADGAVDASSMGDSGLDATLCIDSCSDPAGTWSCTTESEEYSCVYDGACKRKASVGACTSGKVCVASLGCRPCGAAGEPCCAGKTCGTGGTCGTDGKCASAPLDSGMTDASFGDTPPDSTLSDSMPADTSVADSPDSSGPAITKLALGQYHSCALTSDGAVWCWGYNNYGQLGDGTTTMRTVPKVVPGLVGITEIAGSWDSVCAQKGDGTVLCWGWNGSGNLGEGTTTNRLSPATAVSISGTTSIAVGPRHSCARKSDGTVWCWGSNTSGQLGDGTTTDRLAPSAVVGLTNALDVVVGPAHACARRSDGSAVCWGSNTAGAIGDGTMTDRFSPNMETGLASITQLAASSSRSWTCARRSDGASFCWGDNFYGQLGDGSAATRTTAASIPGLAAGGISAGGLHSCAVTTTAAPLCWGFNGAGRLGDGTTANHVLPTSVTSLTGVVEIVAGGNHSCARRTDGTVWCWGSNATGQLGDGTTSNRLAPVVVSWLP